MTGIIHYGNTSFAYDVLHVSRKTMEIAVHPNMLVVVTAPLGALRDDIESRLKKRARWVLHQIDYFQQFEPRTPARCFVSGETHLYLGRQYRLKVVKAVANQVKMTRGRIVVEIDGELLPGRVAEYLEDWYRTRARLYFQACLERCAQNFIRKGYELPKLKIKETQIYLIKPMIARRKRARNRSVHAVHEVFELFCNAASAASAIKFAFP